MDVQQSRHPIDFVIQRVRTGRLALPDFQRDFVWNPTQVVELLDSVSKQWPIGSLLLLSGPQPFAFRAIDSAPKINRTELDLYILDGQQRVTALYHAVANVSRFCYYIDFNSLSRGEDEFIRWERRVKFEKDYQSLAARAQCGIALISDIWEQSNFFDWVKNVESEPLRDRYVRLRERQISGLQAKVYQVMAIELEQGIELEALARIFETLNRTGVALNAFDLLVAKLYPHNFNLRHEWEFAIENYRYISLYSPSGIEILKLISLLIRRNNGRKYSRGVRQGDILSLDAPLIIQNWHQGLELYNSALEICHQYGALSADLIPSWSMVLGIAGCLLDTSADQMRRWWLESILKQTFAQAANTKIVAEFDAGFDGRVSESPIDQYDFLENIKRPARTNGLLTRGLVSILVRSGAKDIISGDDLFSYSDIEIRSIYRDGTIRKLSREEPFENIIVLASTSAKSIKDDLNISKSVDKLKLLETQGINQNTLTRDADFLKSAVAKFEEAR